MEKRTVVVRNEVDPDATFHCDALASEFSYAEEIDFPAGERFDLETAAAVVLTGSTAGVYETETHPWIEEEKALVRELCSAGIPTLGVCFGHQVVNAALGGSVEAGEMTAGLVAADLADIPLFSGVEPVVPALHGDVVTEAGENLDVTATTDHAPVFGTRHADAPLWTVQFHPEFDQSLESPLAAYDWDNGEYSFADVTAKRVFENFTHLAARQ